MISLRELTLADAAAVRRIYSDTSVKYLPRTAMTAESAVSWVTGRIAERHAVPRTLYCFGIDHSDGLVGVVKLNPARTSAALSYILREDVWGHGYATKAVALVLDFASTTLGLASVCAKHHPDNHASGRVLTKLSTVTYMTADTNPASRSPEVITYSRNLRPTRFDVLMRGGYLVASRTYNWALSDDM
ncbi:GNAT family N-acetyltransferase [Streptomyces mirabilis]|uniref:Ribosomal-protein-alanine N-acetyltransferase n=1 Tax=Streptomyces mirabilis TaxID=68239 RepID=A0A1I2VNM8_9ACTN|nr:GNAT family N-acetyltransferase [Streptomyces mirabilis]SFG89857.1 ribosomal-protein-alanine N-acetyltransferase [Streptomyces mirabilis]